MKQLLCAFLLVTSGCYYQGYAVRRVGPSEPPVSREEIERLTTAGISEPVMTELVEKRGASSLTPEDLVALKKAGTPDPVVQKMIATERKLEPVPVDGAYVYPSEYYYYDAPYYYASYGYGFGWGWGYYHPYNHGYLGVRGYR